MDGFTLFTFFFESPYVACSVELLGSWDNFSKPYKMERDHRKGPTNWSGCHKFEGIVCDGDPSHGYLRRDGGLKTGGTYWYYYRLDNHVELYDPTQPSTMTCPLLPGQLLNVLDVPIESDAHVYDNVKTPTDAFAAMVYTLNPLDKFQNPVPPGTPIYPKPVSPSFDLGNDDVLATPDLRQPSLSEAVSSPTTQGSIRKFKLLSRGRSSPSAPNLRKICKRPALLNLRKSRSASSPLDKDRKAFGDSLGTDRSVRSSPEHSPSANKNSRSGALGAQEDLPLAEGIGSAAITMEFGFPAPSTARLNIAQRRQSSLSTNPEPAPDFPGQGSDGAMITPTCSRTQGVDDSSIAESSAGASLSSSLTARQTEISPEEAAGQTWFSWSPNACTSFESEPAYEQGHVSYAEPQYRVECDAVESEHRLVNERAADRFPSTDSGTQIAHPGSLLWDSTANLKIEAASPTLPLEYKPVMHGELTEKSFQLFPDLRCLQPGSHFSVWTDTTSDSSSMNGLDEMEFPSFSTMPGCSSSISSPLPSPGLSHKPMRSFFPEDDQSGLPQAASILEKDRALPIRSDFESFSEHVLRSPSIESEGQPAGMSSPECFQSYALPTDASEFHKNTLDSSPLFPTLVPSGSCDVFKPLSCRHTETRLSFAGQSLVADLVSEFGFLGEAVS